MHMHPIVQGLKETVPEQHRATLEVAWQLGLQARLRLGKLLKCAAALYLLGPSRHDPDHPPVWDPIAVRQALDTVDLVDRLTDEHDKEQQAESFRAELQMRAADLRRELAELETMMATPPPS